MPTSRSLNKVLLIGNLTRNPVLRQTTGDAVVCTFGLATNSTWRDSKGNIQERTEFHNIVAWNKLGEICAQILSTGMLVWLEGELRTRVWDDASGNKRYRTEVKLEDMKLLDDKDKKGVGLDAAKKAGESENDEEVPVDEVEHTGSEKHEFEAKREEKKAEKPAAEKAEVKENKKRDREEANEEKNQDEQEDGEDLF